MRTTTGLALAVSCTLIAGKVAGQACVGLPLQDYQAAIAGNVSFADNAKTYGGMVGYNPFDPLTLSGGINITKYDNFAEDDLNIGGQLGYEVLSTNLSACPVFGVQYTTFTLARAGLPEGSSLTFPIGLGVGTSGPVGSSGNTRIMLNAVPQYLHIRTSIEDEDTESDNEFAIDLGLRLYNAQLFGGAGVRFTTLQDRQGNTEPIFSLTFGFVF